MRPKGIAGGNGGNDGGEGGGGDGGDGDGGDGGDGNGNGDGNVVDEQCEVKLSASRVIFTEQSLFVVKNASTL